MKRIIVPVLFILLVITNNITEAQKNITSKIKVFFNHPVDTARSNGVKATYITNTLSDTMSAYINRAKYTVDVAQYDYTAYGTSGVGKYATAINNAYTRGVKVRWIHDGSAPNSGLKLLNSSIHTLASPVGGSYNIMHNKFIIIDVDSPDSNDAIVWTGSSDWSDYMETGDYNNNLTIQSKQLALAFTQEFDIMWGDTIHGGAPNNALSKFGPFKTSVANHMFNVDGSEIELYFSPTDSVNHQILKHIATANTDVYSAMYAFSEDADANAIVSAKKSGAYAACVLDQYSLAYNAYTILTNYLGANVALYTGSEIYHDKYLIVDPSNACSDPIVLTGSHNWTATANSTNDENTVIIHNDTIANMYYQSFAEDFLIIAGTPLDTIQVACALGINPIRNNSISIEVHPNPYTDKATLTYNLQKPELVSVNICDIAGRIINTLVNGEMQEVGEHQIQFKGQSPGIYFLHIKAGDNSSVKKIVKVQ